MPTFQQRIKSAFSSASVRRSRDLAQCGISRMQLQMAVARGLLERTGRGLYALQDSAGVTEHHTLAEVGQRIPKGTFCLLTALRFHELTTQNPHDLWIAIPRNAWRPRLDTVELRIVHVSGPAFEEGVEHHDIEGISVRLYSPAKTVADCFKFRNKIVIDVELEALREAWRGRRVTMKELERYAKIDRVANVMRPYLETLT